MDITIFYAWQSDRPGNVNRYLIRDAAKEACERISEDKSNDWNLDLDSDTKGVAGMCDIPNTILRKIRKSDIFLGDLTIVGKSEGTQKLLPNTNVVIELGYAARHLNFGALIGVMNEAFGSIEGQVFDIKRRDCLKYTLLAGATKKDRDTARDALSKQFEEVIRITIEQVVIPRRTTQAYEASAQKLINCGDVPLIMSVGGAGQSSGGNFSTPQGRLTIEINIANVGRTPALAPTAYLRCADKEYKPASSLSVLLPGGSSQRVSFEIPSLPLVRALEPSPNQTHVTLAVKYLTPQGYEFEDCLSFAFQRAPDGRPHPMPIPPLFRKRIIGVQKLFLDS